MLQKEEARMKQNTAMMSS